MSDLVLVSVTGRDKPGVTHALTRVLTGTNVVILDIGQSVIHQNLNLGMLFDLSACTDSSKVMLELLYKAHELELDLKFNPVSHDEYSQWANEKGKDRQIITLLARRVTSEHISMVSQILTSQELNISEIVRLSGRLALEQRDKDEGKSCVQLTVRGTAHDADAMRAAFMTAATDMNVDIAWQKDDLYRRNRRLVVFDMDSTLIEAEVIDELAKEAGVGEQVAEITELAMQGKLDFQQSFRQRMALLKGLDESVLEKIAERLPITEGADHLIRNLKLMGYKTAILSGGFNYFGRYLQKRFGVDYVYANELEIVDGKVTGNVVGTIVDGNRKAELLREIAECEGIRLEQTIAVGDGANDLPMLNLAGLGIAFRAKPMVRENAGQSISTLGLDGILYLLGFRDQDFQG